MYVRFLFFCIIRHKTGFPDTYLWILEAEHIKNTNKAIGCMLDGVVEDAHGLGRLGASRSHCGRVLRCYVGLMVDALVAATWSHCKITSPAH